MFASAMIASLTFKGFLRRGEEVLAVTAVAAGATYVFKKDVIDRLLRTK